MSLKEIFLEQISENILETTFAGTLILGEPFFLLSSFLLADNLSNIFLLALSGVFANLVYDLFFFFIPHLSFLKKIKIPKYFSKKYKKANKKIISIENKNTLLVLLSSKFVLGTRNITLLSLGSNKINPKKFILESLVASLIWVFLILLLGFLGNKGFILINEESTGIPKILLTAGFLLIIVFIILNRYFHSHFHKIVRRKNVNK